MGIRLDQFIIFCSIMALWIIFGIACHRGKAGQQFAASKRDQLIFWFAMAFLCIIGMVFPFFGPRDVGFFFFTGILTLILLHPYYWFNRKPPLPRPPPPPWFDPDELDKEKDNWPRP